MRTCSLDGCRGPHKARGYCNRHYQQFMIHGEAGKSIRLSRWEKDPVKRLEHHGWTVTDSGCWEWDSSRFSNGYGQVSVENSPMGAHRLAHIAWIGPVPDGMVVRHKCDNKPCINPDHLEVGTIQDNVNDRVARRGR